MWKWTESGVKLKLQRTEVELKVDLKWIGKWKWTESDIKVNGMKL